MSGTVGCMFLSLVLFTALNGGLGVPTSRSTGVPELLAVRKAATCAEDLERTIDEGFPKENYKFSFKGFTRTVLKVRLTSTKFRSGAIKITLKLDARHDGNGNFIKNKNDYGKIEHLIKGYRFGFHDDCNRIPLGQEKFTHSVQLSFDNVLEYPNLEQLSLKMKDIQATVHGDCCLPCFVGEVDMIDVESERVRLVRAVTSKSCEKRSGGDRICSVGSFCPIVNVIFGTEKNDYIRGTPGRDYIYGLGGNDRIKGFGGDDVIFGGTGNDQIEGGDGNDYIYGEDGDDRVDGGSGNDRIDGGGGRDRLVGGSGNDEIDGGADRDIIAGGADNDVIFGGKGRDLLDGDGTHTGRGGDDVIYGGEGNDRIVDTTGFNRLYGEEGNDFIFGGTQSYIDGGKGNDFLREFGEGINIYGGPGDDFILGDGSNPLDSDGYDVHLPKDGSKPRRFG